MTDELLLQSVLHSRTRLAMDFDPATGEAVGQIREEAGFQRAAFTRSKTDVLARPNVSAVLFGSFRLYPTQPCPVRPRTSLVRGILHPRPDYPLDPALLPDVAFGRFKSWPLRERVEVEWGRG